MEKEIYIIKNNINNKVYVGQAINSYSRFKRHISDAICNNGNSLLDAAIRRYGEKNFWYEVLEITCDYDEREKYWIKYFNSLNPNSYNLSGGGAGGGIGVDNAKSLIRDENVLKQIINDIQFSNLKLVEIGKKYNLSLRLISSINRGTSYFDKNLNYPLRGRSSDFLSEQVNDLIAKELAETTKSYRQLAQEYKVSTFRVGEINRGSRSNSIIQDFPIRKKEIDPIFEEIKRELLYTDKSIRQIAKDLNIAYSKVQSFNCGKYHKDDKITYPIRKSKL